VLINVEPLSGRSHVVHVWVCDGRLSAGRHLVVALATEDHVCGVVFVTVFDWSMNRTVMNETREEQTISRSGEVES